MSASASASEQPAAPAQQQQQQQQQHPPEEPANGVPPAAIRWIAAQLRGGPSGDGGNRAAAARALLLPTRGLDALRIQDLRSLCAALRSRLDGARTHAANAANASGGAAAAAPSAAAAPAAPLTLTARQLAALDGRVVRPRSGSKKAEWVAAVRRCFHEDGGCARAAPPDDPIWALLGHAADGRSRGSSSGRSASAAASGARSPPPAGCGGGATAAAGSRKRAAAAPLPQAAGAAAAVAVPSVLPPPAAPDYVDFFVAESEWPPPRTNGILARLVRIKREGGREHRVAADPQQQSSSSSSSHGTASYSSAGTAAAAAAAGSAAAPSSSSGEYFDDHPRDAREMSWLGQLRTMGFTDQREMLAGLRHVAAAGGGGIGVGIGSYLDSATVLENAMMWIISQREEAEEARKMDRARILAENEQAREEERRRAEAGRRLEEAPIEDIVGQAEGGEGDDGDGGDAAPSLQAATPSKHHRAGRSKYFHFSILLHSPLVRGVFLSISCPVAKKELVRLLRLEQKANQWYGSVLPWAYFRYVAAGRIEKWAHNESGESSGSDADAPKGETAEKARDITSLIRNEANILERALFALSEQHHNGLQNVPKVFIKARDDCAKKGLPDGPEGQATGDKSLDSDDDDVVLVTGVVSATSAASTNKSANDDLDRKPAALPVASPRVPSHSPRRNCASSDRKKPAKKSSEVFEVM